MPFVLKVSGWWKKGKALYVDCMPDFFSSTRLYIGLILWVFLFSYSKKLSPSFSYKKFKGVFYICGFCVLSVGAGVA